MCFLLVVSLLGRCKSGLGLESRVQFLQQAVPQIQQLLPWQFGFVADKFTPCL